MEKQVFKKALDKNKVKRPIFKNTIKAFFVGGLISVIAQGLLDLYKIAFDLKDTYANSLMSITLVFVASLLTGVGVYEYDDLYKLTVIYHSNGATNIKYKGATKYVRINEKNQKRNQW